MRIGKLIRDSQAWMLTFGGNQPFLWKAGQELYANKIIAQNDSFIILQSGLNFYVLESQAVELIK